MARRERARWRGVIAEQRTNWTCQSDLSDHCDNGAGRSPRGAAVVSAGCRHKVLIIRIARFLACPYATNRGDHRVSGRLRRLPGQLPEGIHDVFILISDSRGAMTAGWRSSLWP